jgi:ABC-type transport system involved in multi-copper enzyme maturation permease subunit
MIIGLLHKTLRETWLATVLFALALAVVERLLTFILPQVLEQIGETWAQLPFAKTLLSALLGMEMGDQVTARMMQAILWVHPVVLALVWAAEIIFCTRMPAGEIDRGTVDLLLGLPVARRTVYWCESAVCLASGAIILGSGSAGYFLGTAAMPQVQWPAPERVLLVLVNFYCVYVAVAGVAYLISALSSRRGRAVAAIFVLVLASFLLNFLAQFWEPARRVAFLGVLNYYQPAGILSEGSLSARHILVLLGTGLGAWLVGAEVMARRTICTV